MRRTHIIVAAAAALVIGGAAVAYGATGGLPFGSSPWEESGKRLDAALAELAAGDPVFAVAVLDKVTGEQFSYRGSEPFDTASVVKTSVLTCTLLQAQDESRQLTAEQESRAEAMIRASDNDATTALFNDLGGVDGLTACNERIGLRGTTVNKAWGLTTTTADDQVRLLGYLVTDDSELKVAGRQYVLDLMSTVNEDQGWGVPSAARAGEQSAVKNGWDTRSADGGRWVVNSIGRVVSPDRSTNVSIVVLSHHHQTQEEGVALVERITALTREHLAY